MVRQNRYSSQRQREQLKRKDVRVAGDLTTTQLKVIKGYRDKGQRAYYKGNRFIVAGPLPSSRWHQDSYADAVRHGTDHRLQHRSQGSSYTASRGLHRRNGYHTSCQGNNRGLMISKRTAGNRLPVELQVTTGVLGGGGDGSHTTVAGQESVTGTENHRRMGATLCTSVHCMRLSLVSGKDRTVSVTVTGETRTSSLLQ